MSKYCWCKKTGELLEFISMSSKYGRSSVYLNRFDGSSSILKDNEVITGLEQYYNSNSTFGKDYMQIVTTPDGCGSYERSVLEVAFVSFYENDCDCVIYTKGVSGSRVIKKKDIRCIEILNNKKEKKDGKEVKLSKKVIRVVSRERTTGRVPVLRRGVIKHLTR